MTDEYDVDYDAERPVDDEDDEELPDHLDVEPDVPEADALEQRLAVPLDDDEHD